MKRLLLLAMAIIFAMQLSAQTTVVVGDTLTSETDQYLPIYTYYQNSHAQSVYPAESLQQGLITKVTYYVDSNPYSNGTIKIYMKESSSTAVPSFEPGTGFVEVYSGPMNGGSGGVTYQLTAPFVYTGAGNLIVAVIRDGTAYASSASRYKVTPGSSIVGYSDNHEYSINGSGTVDYVQNKSAIPVAKFEITDLEGYCFAPNAVNVPAATIESNSATVTWGVADESSTLFGIAYKEEGTEEWFTLSENITETSYTITNLDSYTRYDVKVWTICDDEISDEVMCNFITLPTLENCLSIPYEQSFDDLEDIASWDLWSVDNIGVNKWYLGSLGAHLESEDEIGAGLYISNDGGMTNSYTHEASVAHLSTLINIEEGMYYGIEFDYKAAGELNWDDVAVSLFPIGEEIPNNNTDLRNSSNMIANTQTTANQWTRVSILLPENLEPTVYQLVISWKNDGGSGSNPAASLDNLYIFSTSCARVTEFATTMEDAGTSVTMNVDVEDLSNDAAEYIVEYSYLLADGTWSDVLTAQSENPVQITGLPYATELRYKVTAACNGNDVAVSSDYNTVYTLCTSISELPYLEDFNGKSFISDRDTVRANASSILCWYNVHGGNGYYYWNAISSTEGVGSSSALYFYGTTYTTDFSFSEWFVSPIFELTGSERLNFEYKTTSTTNPPIIDVYAMDVSENDYSAMADTANFTLVSSINTQGVTSGVYNMAEIFLSEYSGNTRLAFAVRGISSSFYIDNVMVSEIPSCPDVYGLSVLAGNQNVNVSYDTGNVTEAGVIVAYAEVEEGEEFDLATATTVAISADEELPYLIEGLTAGATYAFVAQQACDGNWSLPVTVSMPFVYEAPINIDFDTQETTPIMEFTSTNTTNVWLVGTAINNTVDATGTPTTGGALYVSTDNGVTAGYSAVSTTATASLLFSLEPGMETKLSFDYKVGGESYYGYYMYDYLNVYLVPVGESRNTTHLLINQVCEMSGWQTYETTLSPVYSGLYSLEFVWYNDNVDAYPPGGVIDNISIVQSACVPTGVDWSATGVETEDGTATLVVNVIDTINTGATYVLRYKSQAATEYTEVSALTIEDFPYTIGENINFQTVYNLQLGLLCSGEELPMEIGATTIQTPCAALSVPWNEDFTTNPLTTPSCWERYTGYSEVISESGLINMSSLTATTYGWTHNASYSCGSTTSSMLRAELYGSSDYLAISPVVDLGNDGVAKQIAFDLGARDYYDNAAPNYAQDERIMILVSLDNGVTWDIANGIVFANGDEDTVHNLSSVTNHMQRYAYKLVDENDEPLTGLVRFAFYIESQAWVSGCDAWVCLDNITVEEWSECQTPYGLSVSSITSNSATVAFQTWGETTTWEYVVVEGVGEEANIDGGSPVQITSTEAIVLTDLSPLTEYTFAIRSVCENSSSPWATATFLTMAAGEPVPYMTSFDDANDALSWFYTHNTTNNLWTIGTATASEEDGGSAAYISADNGTTYSAVVGNSTTRAYIWKDFSFGESEDAFELSFDWKMRGRSSGSSAYCGIQVYLTDLVTPPTEALPSESDRVTLVLGSDDWTNETIYLGNITGDKRLVFLTWGYTSADDIVVPAAIDNVSISVSTCTPVTTPIVGEVTSETATITWEDADDTHTSWNVYYKASTDEDYTLVTVSTPSVTLTDLVPATTYYLYVRTNCGGEESVPTSTISFDTPCVAIEDFPYTEGFNAQNVMCWSTTPVSGTNNWGLASTYQGDIAPVEGAYFVIYKTTTRGTSARLISPVFDLTSLSNPHVKFSHIAKVWGSDQDELKVQYRTSSTDEWVDLVHYTTNFQTWTLDSLALPNPSSTYQISFLATSDYGYGVGLDAITVYDAEGEGGTTDPEPDPCDAPTALVANNITETTADITWTGTATSYEVRLNAGAAETVTGTTKQYTGLTANTAYTVEVRAVCEGQTSDWASVQFTTLEEEVVVVTPPTVATLAATEVTHESATLNGTITAGNETITAQGFMYKATAAADWTTVAATGTTLAATVTNLTAETAYSFKAFATTASGTVEGTVMTFTTTAAPVVIVAPTATTLAATEVTHESATLNGTITAGSETITAQGFMYKATAAADWTTVAATGANITATLTALTAETEYTFKAFATTASGTVEGTAMTFTTTAAPVVVTPPTVVTLPASTLTHSSAVLNGTVTAGSEAITAQGFMYKPTAASDWTTVAATGENMTLTVEGLEAEMAYDFKAFATTASGTVEGEVMSFITLSGLNDATANAINAMIYPNPADDKATISVSGIAAGAKIVVSDMQGRIIMSDDMIEANYDLNVSNYAAGVYYIRIISGNTVSTQKLIVK